MAEKKRLKIGVLEGAPDWYGTPFDKLNFEWSHEEKLELERYCEKINKNIAEEDMTARQRFRATMEGKPKDRVFIEALIPAPFLTRVLDNYSDAVKPVDVYRRPKLHAKVHIANAARYKLDIINIYTITYTENFWGADAKMIDYGTPMILGDPPIKTMADMEDIEVPDPLLHGLYPGYLWAAREIIKILKDYKCDLPLELSFCGGPMGTAFMGNMMMTMRDWLKAARKEPEVAKKTIELSSEFSVKFGKACKSVNPDGLYMCDVMGSVPFELASWTIPFYTKIGTAVKAGTKTPYQWLSGGALGWMDWYPHFWEGGALGPQAWDGWWKGEDLPVEKIYPWFAEHNLYYSHTVSDIKMLDGDPSIEADIKLRCDLAKKHPKAGTGLGSVDYWTPPQHLDQCIAWSKKHGRF